MRISSAQQHESTKEDDNISSLNLMLLTFGTPIALLLCVGLSVLLWCYMRRRQRTKRFHETVCSDGSQRTFPHLFTARKRQACAGVSHTSAPDHRRYLTADQAGAMTSAPVIVVQRVVSCHLPSKELSHNYNTIAMNESFAKVKYNRSQV